jgi:RNA polymerase sigma factor (sigma-70 family)
MTELQAEPFVLSLRRDLSAMVRRRVPAAEVEDITQTVLCDTLHALAQREPLSGPEELRRFAAGVARHKVADFHRRARFTEVPSEVEATSPPAPLEARALLGQVTQSITSPRERETLGWLVREHEGEQLREIAKEVGLPAPAVRQRVSRLRRAIRARWAHALVAIVALGSCGALARTSGRFSAVGGEPIVAEPDDPIVRDLAAVSGRWRLVSVTGLAHAPSLTLDVSGRRVTGATPTGLRVDGVVTRVQRRDGSVELDLEGPQKPARVIVRLEPDGTATVTMPSGPLRGAAHFVRAKD